MWCVMHSSVAPAHPCSALTREPPRGLMGKTARSGDPTGASANCANAPIGENVEGYASDGGPCLPSPTAPIAPMSRRGDSVGCRFAGGTSKAASEISVTVRIPASTREPGASSRAGFERGIVRSFECAGVGRRHRRNPRRSAFARASEPGPVSKAVARPAKLSEFAGEPRSVNRAHLFEHALSATLAVDGMAIVGAVGSARPRSVRCEKIEHAVPASPPAERRNPVAKSAQLSEFIGSGRFVTTARPVLRGRWKITSQLAGYFWYARTLAWWARAAPVSIGRSLPARISCMPLSV